MTLRLTIGNQAGDNTEGGTHLMEQGVVVLPVCHPVNWSPSYFS